MALSPASPAFGSGSSPGSSRRWKVALLGVAVVVLLLDLWAMSTWQRSLDPQHRGTLSAGFDPSVQAGGWQTIVKLGPNSPLRSAGASVGDSVRFHHRGEAWLRRFGTDEQIDLDLKMRCCSAVKAAMTVALSCREQLRALKLPYVTGSFWPIASNVEARFGATQARRLLAAVEIKDRIGPDRPRAAGPPGVKRPRRPICARRPTTLARRSRRRAEANVRQAGCPGTTAARRIAR